MYLETAMSQSGGWGLALGGQFAKLPLFHQNKQNSNTLYFRTQNLISVTENSEEISSDLNLESFVSTENYKV